MNKKPYNKKRTKKSGSYKSTDNKDDFKDRKNKADDSAYYDKLASNDINWWNKTTSIYPQVTKIPFNRILGDPMRVVNGTTAYQGVTSTPIRHDIIPGILTVDFTPTVGRCVSPTDAVNLAADRIYSYIYQNYTGAQNFTKADVFFQIMHEQSIACLIAVAKRGLRSLFSYSQVNHNFPRLMYEACGFEESNFNNDVLNYPQLVKTLNQLILSFNSLYTPRITEVFDRWYSLCNNVWLDDADVASQMFLFRPTGYYVFEEAHDDGSGNLIPSQMSYVGIPDYNSSSNPGINVGSINDVLSMISALLASIRNTTYFGVVNASLAKAFPANQLLSIQPFVDGEIISPIFDRNMNWQLNNTISHDWVNGQYRAVSPNGSVYDIKEDVTNNTIVCDLKVDNISVHNFTRRDNLMLNSYDGDTSEEFIMESTRLMAYPMLMGSSIVPGTSYANVPLMSGTEVPGKLNIYTFRTITDTSGTSVSNIGKYSFSSFMNVEVTSTGLNFTWGYGGSNDQQNVITTLAMLSKFRNAPRVYIDAWGAELSLSAGLTTTALNQAYHVPMGTMGDVYKFTLITPEGLEGLHDAARLSVFTGIIEKL